MTQGGPNLRCCAASTRTTTPERPGKWGHCGPERVGVPIFLSLLSLLFLKVGPVGWKRETVQVARAVGETHLSGQRKQEKDPISEKMQGKFQQGESWRRGTPKFSTCVETHPCPTPPVSAANNPKQHSQGRGLTWGWTCCSWKERTSGQNLTRLPAAETHEMTLTATV